MIGYNICKKKLSKIISKNLKINKKSWINNLDIIYRLFYYDNKLINLFLYFCFL